MLQLFGKLSARRRKRQGRRSLETLESRLPLHASVVISEIMYQPTEPTAAELLELPDVTASDFEYVELLNTEASQTVSTLDMQLAGDIQLMLADESLSAGESAVVVANQAAFQQRYGESIRILGEYSGQLDDLRVGISLIDGDAHVLAELQLAEGELWARRARGIGSSLELIDPITTLASQINKPSRWQASVEFGGSPGAFRREPSPIQINEIRAGFDSASERTDQIELRNTSNASIDVSGWYLSDDPTHLLKYVIPNSTTIAANGYLLLNSTHFNPTPETPGPNDLSLDALHGGDVFVLIVDDDGQPVEFVDDAHYGSQDNESWGRVGADRFGFGPLLSSSFGAANVGGVIGPLLITEVNYHAAPPSPAALGHDPNLTSQDLEFVELSNRSAERVDLSAWALQGSIQFEFPLDAQLAPGETVVVVGFDPSAAENAGRLDAFIAHYGVVDPFIVGGYSGQLGDDYGSVRLMMAGVPPVDEPELTPWYQRDALTYDDVPPWPSGPDGNGLSLNRVAPDAFGGDASNWEAAALTPGSVPFDPPVQALLPDLAFWDDPLVGVNYLEYVEDHPITGRTLMRFSTGVANNGVGPLEIVAGELVDGARQVVQIVQNDDGSQTEYDAGQYVFHPTHGHVHFADYAFYRLREVTETGDVGPIVAGGEKVSFCLVDSHPLNLALGGAPSLPIYKQCESSTQGISVGWADLYSADLDDQWIDIEDVPPGEYWFETVVDPFNLLLESDETNNLFLHKVTLHVPQYEPDFLDAQEIDDHRITGDQVITDLSIHQPGDVDVFRWTAPRTGPLDVQLAFDPDLGDVDLYVWTTDQDNDIVVSSSVTDNNGSEAVELAATAGKTYFFVVKDLGGNTHPSYRLIVDGPGIPPDANEPNNSILDVTDLGAGEMLVSDLNLDGPLDQDFYVWTTTITETIRIELLFDAQDADLDLFIHDFDNHRILASTTNGQETVEFKARADAGYVIVVMSPTNEVIGQYDLRLSHVEIPRDALESNDSIETATALAAGDSQQIGLNIHSPDDVDFFRWTPEMSGPAVVDLLFSQSDGDLELVLWQDGQEVRTVSTTTDNERLAFAAEANQEYLLQVRGIGGETSISYDLLVTAPRLPRVTAAVALKADRVTEVNLLAPAESPITIPWLDLRYIQIEFSTDVQVQLDDLQLTGSVVPEYQVLDFLYDEATRRATWTIQTPVLPDTVELELSDTIVDSLSHPLDGEFGAPTGDGNPGGSLVMRMAVRPGDFAADGQLDVLDIDSLAAGLRADDAFFDLNGDGQLNEADVEVQTVLMEIPIGDTDLNGVFDADDLILIFARGEYEDDLPLNSTWADGDWNGDGDFNVDDLIFAFAAGVYDA